MYTLSIGNNKEDSDISLCLNNLVGFLVLWVGVYIVMAWVSFRAWYTKKLLEKAKHLEQENKFIGVEDFRHWGHHFLEHLHEHKDIV